MAKAKKPAKGKPAGKSTAKAVKETVAKAKHPHLPGMEPKKEPAVHKAALEYAEAHDARMNAGKVEVELRAVLIEKMHGASLSVYRFGDVKVTLESKDKVKVKVAGEDEDLDEEDAPKTEAQGYGPGQGEGVEFDDDLNEVPAKKEPEPEPVEAAKA